MKDNRKSEDQVAGYQGIRSSGTCSYDLSVVLVLWHLDDLISLPTGRHAVPTEGRRRQALPDILVV